MKRPSHAISTAARSPCTMSSRPLTFPRSRRPRQRLRVGCVAQGWELQSRAKLSKPSRTPFSLKHANDVDAIEEMIMFAAKCRVDDTWHSWELNRAADEAVQHQQSSTQNTSSPQPQLPFSMAAACTTEQAETTSSSSRQYDHQLQQRPLAPLRFQRTPALRPDSNLDMLLEMLIR